MKQSDLKAKLNSLKDNAKAIMAVAVFIFLLDGIAIVKFQIVPLAHLWKKTNLVKSDIRVAREDSKSASIFKNKLTVLKTEVAVLDKKTILQEEVPRALEAISKAADVSSVKILKIRPMTEIKGSQKTIKISAAKEFSREKISISAVGGFHQLGRFIALLENSPVFYDIKKLEIRSDSQGRMQHSLTIILDVIIRKS